MTRGHFWGKNTYGVDVRDALRKGDLVQPDSDNPAHRVLQTAMYALSQEYGIQPRLLVAPVKNRMAAFPDYQPGSFKSYVNNNLVVAPESAGQFFSSDETTALLTHEFGHLLYPALAEAKKQASLVVLDEALEMRESGLSPEAVAARLGTSGMLAPLQAASDVSEMTADELVIKAGRGPALASALEKIRVYEQGANVVDTHSPDQVMQIIAKKEADYRVQNPIGAAHHLSIGHAERVRRLDGEREGQGRGR